MNKHCYTYTTKQILQICIYMVVYLSVELDAWQHLRKATDKQFSRSGGVLSPWLTCEQEAWLRCVWGDDKRSEIWEKSWRSDPAAARP